MKKWINSAFYGVLAMFITFVMAGCASMSMPEAPTGPVLGVPTPLQETLNAMPEVSVAGKKLKFTFGGDTWISKVDGKDFSAGTFKSEDTAKGSIITLQQTHVYSTIMGAGWVPTPAPDIVLEYKQGPPKSLAPKK